MGSESIGTPALWTSFTSFVRALLALDLGVLHRNAHEVCAKRSPHLDRRLGFPRSHVQPRIVLLSAAQRAHSSFSRVMSSRRRGPLTRSSSSWSPSPSLRCQRTRDAWTEAVTTTQTSSTTAAALRAARKVAVAVVGVTVTAVGAAFIVLPGPAVIVIPLGLAILATEFLWARRLLRRGREGITNGRLRS